MIVDKIKIYIKAGNGGDGAVSFRREKYVSAGGPDGGNGGNGGNIVFAADTSKRTLMDFRMKRKYVAEHGHNGNKKNMTGASGEDMVIHVPLGTVIYDAETGRVVADLHDEQPVVVLQGGRGGRGNASFASSTRQTPRFSTPGKRTIEREVILELKSIADVGLVGYPNVGKSTLLSTLTSARPKIDNYHFTTLAPNLGVVQTEDDSFVLADIPGLIEGASDGTGLGHDFLRHIERTRMIAHVLDISGIEGRDPLEDYQIIREELESYSEKLIERPEIIVANKADLPSAQENFERFTKKYPDKKIYLISAATTEGVNDVKYAMVQLLQTLPEESIIPAEGVLEEWESAEKMLTAQITYDADGILEVSGTLIDDIFSRINPEDPASMRHFQKLLNDQGIIDMLRDAGAQDGDTIRLNDMEFDFVD